MSRVLILHYHEIWLKGGNRRYFTSRLVSAIKAALAGLPIRSLEHLSERLILTPSDPAALEAIVERAKKIFGLAYIALAESVAPEIGEIGRVAREMTLAKQPASFAVRAKIAYSEFGMNSMEVERAVGREILEALRAVNPAARVNLSKPELTCTIEVIPSRAMIYTDRIEGAGGLPAVTGGRLVALVSGGFDSGVAAWKMMRRGAHCIFVHFFATPSPASGSSLPIAEQIVRTLTPYQFTSRLYMIPFDTVQREIVTRAPEHLRTLLYRRMMARIATEIARAERALGLITGDSVSQVASQTLHNLRALDHALTVPVYRPLAGDDKEEILRLARRIGTYSISCEPFEDCCPRFMPRSPAIFASVQELVRAEANLDLAALTRAALEAGRITDFKYDAGEVSEVAGNPRRLSKIAALRKSGPASEADPVDVPHADGARA